MTMKNTPSPSSGRQQQYERDLERYRNESAQIGESLFQALERRRNSRDWIAIIRRIVFELWALARPMFYDIITSLLSGLW